ncbi:MAG: prepilin-type N-terminal cleavage/methylation domain-containing protein [Acidobacteria bacterium]|nr:prepilin-type N-terminal cleavage/methylation domain-containing protein [Acidobacteriota bacterium]
MSRRDSGFTLVEVMICTLILTVGMLAIAGLLGVTTRMEIGAREAARSARLAQEKIDELMRADFDTNATVAVGGSLTSDAANHYEASPDGLDGITIRWLVQSDAGLPDETRILTVRVVNLRAQQYRNTDISTIIRDY